jgi:hypothetical protein
LQFLHFINPLLKTLLENDKIVADAFLRKARTQVKSVYVHLPHLASVRNINWKKKLKAHCKSRTSTAL